MYVYAYIFNMNIVSMRYIYIHTYICVTYIVYIYIHNIHAYTIQCTHTYIALQWFSSHCSTLHKCTPTAYVYSFVIIDMHNSNGHQNMGNNDNNNHHGDMFTSIWISNQIRVPFSPLWKWTIQHISMVFQLITLFGQSSICVLSTKKLASCDELHR